MGQDSSQEEFMQKRFTEEQIIGIVKEAVSGMAARDLCRKHNISEQTFYRWKTTYAGTQAAHERAGCFHRESG
jgi:putative transposase